MESSRTQNLERLSCVDHTGEVSFEDPYRYLEDESPASHAWVAAQNRLTDHFIGELDTSIIQRALEYHYDVAQLAAPGSCGGNWFWLKRSADGCGATVDISAQLEGPRSTVVAAAQFAPHGNSIDWHHPSPDGKWLAVGVARSGEEQAILYLGRVDGSEGFSARVLNAFDGRLCWLPDSSGLYCAAGRGRETEANGKQLWFVPTEGTPTRVQMPPRVRDRIGLSLQLSSDGRYLAVSEPHYAPCLRAILDRDSGEWLAGLADPLGFIFAGAIIAERYVAITCDNSPYGRVVSVPLTEIPNRASWRQLVAPSKRMMRGMMPCNEGLLLYEIADRSTRLRFFDLDGNMLGEPELPPQAAVIRSNSLVPEQMGADVPIVSVGEDFMFSASSATTSNALFRFRGPDGVVEQLTEPRIVREDYTARSVTVPTDDGELRFDVISPHELDDGLPQPVLLTGYGGFNIAQLPAAYLGPMAAWLDAGGVVAYAHLPGDGTFSLDQWINGRLEHKQRTYDHFLVIAEHLLASGHTTSGQLAICGASNGGLLVAAAITRRPELFAAAAMLVPHTDIARQSREPFLESGLDYGDARVLPDARWIRDYSPYHNVRAGVQYPPTIVVCGSRDVRTRAWHARKMTAALQAAAPGSSRILLRTNDEEEKTGFRDCGHMGALTPACTAEWMSFLMHHVGLDPADLPSMEGVS